MKITGADIVMECLKEQSVDTVFGYPGGYVIHIYDALHKNEGHFNHILTAHEQGASHAADGYARSTGKTGVCFATSGPGATNLVTGIATAYMDSIPMVCITGNVPLNMLGKDAFQEVDIVGITTPITKQNYIVKDIEDLADTIREAFYIAQEGRPGPVLVDIPKNVQMQEFDYIAKEPMAIERITDSIKESDIDQAIKMIDEAKKPFILMGGGVVISEAKEEFTTFAEKIQAPVTSTLMGLGGFDGDHEQFTGMIGMHGTKTSNLGAQKSDLIIAVGARFSDRVIGKSQEFAKNAKILHIDVDPAEINKNVQSDHHIIGDIKEVLERVNSKIDQKSHNAWLKEVQKMKKDFPLKYPQDGLRGQYIIEKLNEITKGDAIITTEVGQHQMWTAQFYKFKTPKSLVSSGGLGTMGFGLGASIGAQLGNPDKRVINIAGDGCFKMNLQELATAVNYNLPITFLVIDNNALGMVRQWQSLFFDKRYSQTTLNHKSNFVGLAENFGMKGYKLDHKEDVEEILKKAVETDGPVLVHCTIDADDKVFPMVAAGEAIDNLILEDR